MAAVVTPEKIAELPDALAMSDISRLTGLHKNAAWNWQRFFADFPKACGMQVGGNNRLSNVYPKVPVLAWLIRHGKIEPVDDIDPDDYLPAIEAEQPVNLPQIDNGLAQDFMRGKFGCLSRAIGTGAKSQTTTIRTEGIWPIIEATA